MRTSRAHRVIAVALRCYPRRWRSRHGEEAALLATALLEDGVHWWSIVVSFVGGATRERIFRKPSRRLGTALVAVVVGVTALPLALFASLAPASASSANVQVVITKPNDAARQLESAFAAHHFRVTIRERVSPASLVGSILSVHTSGMTGANARVLGELHGHCVGGASCVDGLILPHDFSGVAHVTIGRAGAQENLRVR